MRNLLVFTLFVCCFVFTPFAQEKGESIEKESKRPSSQQTTKENPSTLEQKSSVYGEELGKTQKVEIRSSETQVEPKKNRVIKASPTSSEKVKTQQKEKLGYKPLPKDFPKYINTGDPEKDQQDYWSRREEWIEKNPQLYKSYFTTKESSQESQNVTPQKISIK